MYGLFNGDQIAERQNGRNKTQAWVYIYVRGGLCWEKWWIGSFMRGMKFR